MLADARGRMPPQPLYAPLGTLAPTTPKPDKSLDHLWDKLSATSESSLRGSWRVVSPLHLGRDRSPYRAASLDHARDSAQVGCRDGLADRSQGPHVEGGNRFREPLQREHSDRFEIGQRTGFRGHRAVDQDLAVGGFGTKAGRQVAHGADRGVVE